MDRLWTGLRGFFESGALNPHGICLLWRPELIWTHAVSDIVIGMAYFSIPLVLTVFVRRRPDVRFSWAVWMFVAFILLCGVTHFMSVWTLWNADYGVEALLKAATAVVSLATAVALWPLLPKAIALPSTDALQARIDERDAALEDLRNAMNTMVAMREHEARQQLLLNELNHRVKNTLAVVQSVATQTFRNGPTGSRTSDRFIERLMALSSTHDLLVEQQWDSTTLRKLASATLEPYERNWGYSGPDLRLDANLSVSMGMALHELATNALKYGAWRGDGQVAIEVSETGSSAVEIVWRETGGPVVTAPPQRGFGSRLLEQGVAAEFNGHVTLSFDEVGLVCVIRVPLSPRIRVVTPEPA